MKRINKADCVGEELEIYSKVANGLSRKDRAISIRSNENGVKLLDYACTFLDPYAFCVIARSPPVMLPQYDTEHDNT